MEQSDRSTRNHAPAPYEVERRDRLVDRPGLCITEFQIGPRQEVPWHVHTHVQDAFVVLDGEICVSLREPEEEQRLRSGAIYAVRPGRPHRVTNGGDRSATFLNLQHGEYDFVPQA
jgi:quercetin dioxygenase-like cupin family protein